MVGTPRMTRSCQLPRRRPRMEPTPGAAPGPRRPTARGAGGPRHRRPPVLLARARRRGPGRLQGRRRRGRRHRGRGAGPAGRPPLTARRRQGLNAAVAPAAHPGQPRRRYDGTGRRSTLGRGPGFRASGAFDGRTHRDRIRAAHGRRGSRARQPRPRAMRICGMSCVVTWRALRPRSRATWASRLTRPTSTGSWCPEPVLDPHGGRSRPHPRRAQERVSQQCPSALRRGEDGGSS
jgi:hypothetical protein